MAEIAVGEAIGAGFGLIRRRPGSVLVWGVAMAAAAVVPFLLLAPYYIAMIHTFLEARAGGVMPSASDFPGLMEMRLVSNLCTLVQYFFVTVVNCAVLRSILHPEQRTWASLRLGATELLLFVIVAGLFIAFIIGVVIVAIPVVIVAVLLGLAHAGLSVFGLVAAAYLAILCVGVWLMLRLSMIGPMMVEDGKVHLTDAWAMTRGHAGRLFQIGLGVFLILLVGEVVFFGAFAGVGLGLIGAAAGGAAAVPAFFGRPPGEVLRLLAPALAIFSVAAIPLYGAVATIATAPWARAYLDLRDNPASAA